MGAAQSGWLRHQGPRVRSGIYASCRQMITPRRSDGIDLHQILHFIPTGRFISSNCVRRHIRTVVGPPLAPAEPRQEPSIQCGANAVVAIGRRDQSQEPLAHSSRAGKYMIRLHMDGSHVWFQSATPASANHLLVRANA